MPELPEVEVLVRHLDPLLCGQRIRSVTVQHERIIRPHRAAVLGRKLAGLIFRRVRRRAKFLVFELSAPRSRASVALVGHLGMTGRIFLQSSRDALPKHTVVSVDLGRTCLVFEDARRFGRLHLDTATLEALGPEPFSDTFTPEALAAAVGRSRQPIKVRLLDQTVVAGVGNIYASEALFRAGISPRTAARRLTRDQFVRLWRAIREVLAEAIARGSSLPIESKGQTERLFYFGALASGNPTAGVPAFRVYDRSGLPCVVCGTAIVQIVQAVRSTFFCPVCQPGGRGC